MAIWQIHGNMGNMQWEMARCWPSQWALALRICLVRLFIVRLIRANLRLRIPPVIVLLCGIRALGQLGQLHVPYRKFAFSAYSSISLCLQAWHKKWMLAHPLNAKTVVSGMVSGDPRRVSGSHDGIATIQRGQRSHGTLVVCAVSFFFWQHSSQMKTTRFVIVNRTNTDSGKDVEPRSIQPWQRSHRMVFNPSAPRLHPGLRLEWRCKNAKVTRRSNCLLRMQKESDKSTEQSTIANVRGDNS